MGCSNLVFILCTFTLFVGFHGAAARTRHFEFNIGFVNVTKNCKVSQIAAVNGQLPGPAIRIKQGDNVVIKVNNYVNTSMTIHWHGISQVLSAWQDGPAYITQCPIRPNNSFTYRFKVEQVGTLFWHAHISWLRGTVYGAFVIKPRTKYPFPAPYKEETILLGDWYDNLEKEEHDAKLAGRGVPAARAYTINGRIGPQSNLLNSTLNSTCSASDTHRITFVKGKTHLLRIINAALEQNLYFSIANHSMTIVEADASYTKPHTVEKLMVTPGQTYSVLVNANQRGGRYYMAASPWRASNGSLLLAASLGVVDYVLPGQKQTLGGQSKPILQVLPSVEDETSVDGLQSTLRSLNSPEHPVKVPQTVDRRLYLVVAFNWKPCSAEGNCTKTLANQVRNAAVSSSINNVSFVVPTSTSALEAYYNKVGGVYTTDFPDNPPTPYDYAGESTLPFESLQSEQGTKLSVIPFGANVQLVLQTPKSRIGNSTHPFHLHGYDFYIVGQGKGNFNASRDEPSFNLVDPPRRNTALMPRAGWVAIRFHADNPGVWLFHCHLEGHVSFGMEMAFIVENGVGPRQTLPPPPKDLPQC